MGEYDPLETLRVLERQGVEYVVIGAVAARIRGAPVVTADLDVTPSATAANLERLASGLLELQARLRLPEGSEGIAFPIEARMIATAESWTLTTRYGDLDLVFSPAGTGGYNDLRRGASRVEIGRGLTVPVAALVDVIRSKEAAGRPKDHAQLPLLRETLEMSRERERR